MKVVLKNLNKIQDVYIIGHPIKTNQIKSFKVNDTICFEHPNSKTYIDVNKTLFD